MDDRIIGTYTAVMRSSRMLEEASQKGQRLKEEDLEERIALCRKRIETAERGYAKAILIYEDQFGAPNPSNPGGGEAALRMAEETFCDEGLRKLLFRPQTGFFAKKPKAADYQRFCQSAQMIISGYSAKLAYLEEQLEVLGMCRQNHPEYIQAGLKAAKGNIDDSGWDKYPAPAEGCREIYVGDLEVPVEPDAVAGMSHLGIVENENDSAWLQLPFSYNVYNPFSLLVSYEGDTREGMEKLGDLVRSMMYQIIRSMPPYSYEFVYLDPTRGGTTLKELLTELGGVVDGNAYQLHEKLYPDHAYKMLTIASNRDQVREQLKKLENRIAVINSICGGRSVSQFNAPQFDEKGQIAENNPGVIPQVFVFYENIHEVLDRNAMEILQKLADCAGNSGISLVATSVREYGNPMTAEEQSLLKADRLRDDLDHIEILPGGASLYVNAGIMGETAVKNLFFNFKPRFADICHEEYLKMVAAGFRPSLNKETRYEKRIDIDAQWGSSYGDAQFEIPVGVNSRDQIATIAFGGSDCAHGLLAGSTGCGKSSYLHAIINGVIMRYKPTDVQIWLSDYKTAEFRRYMHNTPPHIAYVGIARSVEYTLSFLDRIWDEYERRLEVFGTATSVSEYREVHGRDSMPRIFIVVDEFHVMSNHVRDFQDYKSKLAALLREARAMGITFLLSDQTCGVGLQGLSEDGKLQLSRRMSMMTTNEEYNAVFNISNAKDVIPVQQKYEVTLARLTSRVNSKGVVENVRYYEHCKTLYISPETRDLIAQKSIEAYGPAVDPVFVEAADRVVADWQQIAEEEAKLPVQRGMRLCMGVPVTLQKYFSFRLMANYGENVVNVVPREEILSSIFVTQLENIRRQGDYEIYVIADENDSQFCFCEAYLTQQAALDPHIHIATYIGDVCQTILQLRETMIKRRRMRTYGKIAVFWMGLYDIAREMSFYPAARPAGKETSEAPRMDDLMDSVGSLSAQFDALFGDDFGLADPAPVAEAAYDEEEIAYNATGDISDLMEEGPKRSIHNFCYYTSTNIALKTKCAPISGSKASFTHKIALGIGKEESLDYFGASRLSVDAEGKPLDDKTAVYYNGRTGTQFMPFISRVECGKNV